MLLRNARETTLLARVVQNSKCLLSIRSRSDNSDSAEKIIQLHKENNLTFGKLHETKRDKVRRIKLEAKGKLPESKPSGTNSELAYMLENTNKNLMLLRKKNRFVSKNPSTLKQISQRTIKIQTASKLPSAVENVDVPTEYSKFNQKQETNNIINESTTSKENIQLNYSVTNSTTESEISITDQSAIILNDTSSKNENVVKVDKKNILFPRDYLPNLIEVPVFVKYKSFDEYLEDETKEILSISPMEARACLKYPSVTKVLSATMTEESKAVLEKWKQKMIDKLGPKGFEVYREGLFADGKLFHATVLNKLTGEADQIPEKIKPTFSSLEEVLKNIEKVRAVESHAIHPKLMYRGVVDCVASYRGELCLIDWKKSDKPKHTIHDTYDAPLQLASYIGAINADLKYPFMIKKGLIVVAYTNGDPAKVHVINNGALKMYWKLWLERLTEYHAALDPA